MVVVAPTGAGKSHVLVHLGAQALKQGKNVVHFTLELPTQPLPNVMMPVLLEFH